MTTPKTKTKTASTPRTPKPRRRATARYARAGEYPVTGGHDYMIRSIPKPTWKAAGKRADQEGRRSIRVVTIKLLELYAAKGADVFGGWPADEVDPPAVSPLARFDQ